MRIVSRPVEFEWDAGNIDKNWQKHAVSNLEAEEIFGNEPLMLIPDTSHSGSEKRYHALGKTDANRLLFASFTMRKSKVRIISIRPMSKKEQHNYQQVEAERSTK